MPRRHPLPKLWLLTDERQGDALWRAIARLPRGSGIIVRHYSLSRADRQRLFTRIRALGRARGLIVILAGHNYRHGDPRLASAHNLSEIRAAERARADILLLSPLFATRSHPGRPTLGTLKFATLARATRLPVLALGGVMRHHEPLIARIGAYGRAGIDDFVKRRVS